MLHLVRLVHDDGWHPVRAGAKLRDVIADQQVLRQMAARVRGTLADRPSVVGERAARTLAVAIEAGPGSVVPDELNLQATGLRQVRGVHPGEISAVRRLP
jgi:hypothetical protein